MASHFYNKYHAKKTIVDGITFDSKAEAKRYMELRLLEKQGKIRCLRLQVPYVLIEKSKYGREIKYIADFVYDEVNSSGERTKDGIIFSYERKTIVEDCKGFKTDVYRLKKRLLAERYGIEIKETKWTLTN